MVAETIETEVRNKHQTENIFTVFIKDKGKVKSSYKIIFKNDKY